MTRPVAANPETLWEASQQNKRQKAACYVCNEVFANESLRLRPANTTHTRLLHPACSHGLHISIDKVTNADSLASPAHAQLTQLLAHARATPHQPGDSPTEAKPAALSLKHIEQMDAIPWDRCLECCPCIRNIPQHWLQSVWGARLAIARGIVSAQEQNDTTNVERLWKLFSLFDAMVLAAVPRRRGGSRGYSKYAVDR